jgi:hypothetical protein
MPSGIAVGIRREVRVYKPVTDRMHCLGAVSFRTDPDGGMSYQRSSGRSQEALSPGAVPGVPAAASQDKELWEDPHPRVSSVQLELAVC